MRFSTVDLLALASEGDEYDGALFAGSVTIPILVVAVIVWALYHFWPSRRRTQGDDEESDSGQ